MSVTFWAWTNRSVPWIPDLANRPADRGNVADRSNLADRAKVGDRYTVNNIKIGDVNVGNSVISNRPTWANIDRNQINNINSRWSNQLGGMNDWGRLHPTRVIQLAVSKEGIISGTLYNTETDQAQSVQGQVDKETQRVAFRVGESDNIIVESGLYNLTQADAPVLVHVGGDRVEDWLLVRIEAPAEE